MGRPPIGKKAMTGAERIRRYREKHAVTKPVTKQNKAAASALAVENERLRAACAEKDRELAALRDQAANEAIVRSALQERREDHVAALDKALRRQRRRKSTRDRRRRDFRHDAL